MLRTKQWYAWLNTMPPRPDDFHVTGDVLVGNPGIQAELCMKEPQGINPSVLQLDLHLVQRPGMWPQKETWVQARYDSVVGPRSPIYSAVEILDDGASIASIQVEVVQ